MSKKSVTTDKKIRFLFLTGLAFIFIQNFVMASGDKVCPDSGNAAQEKEIKSQAAEIAGKSEALYVNTALLREASEKELEIENRMINPDSSFWQENEISLENWMFDIHSTFWKEILVNDSEEYAIEDWMVNPKEWTKNTSLSPGNSR